MSPRTTPLFAKDISFPRVSGDEPPRFLGSTAAHRFSLRERG